jgi:beta-lactamase superfamily II metal-dependent hydrolase
MARHRQISKTPFESGRFYAFIDSVIEAVPTRPHSRMSMQLDAIDANAFDNDPNAVDNPEALFLSRISTTPNRLNQLFGLEGIKEGSWLQVELERASRRPRAWLMPSTTGFAPQAPINVATLQRLDGGDALAQLVKSCAAPKARRLTSINVVGRSMREAAKHGLEILALDVGQAACVAFFRDGRCFGYFDIGAPLFFNQRSFPRYFTHQVAENGFVILSHWDFDHYALVYRYPELGNLDWYAPQQPVGPNTARFQRSLGSRLKFISGNITAGNLLLRRCTGTAVEDRNSTGYALRVQLPGAGVVLTGDADYPWIQPALLSKANRLVIPHHGGSGSRPPVAARGRNSIAVVSYGVPNTYRHPDESHLAAHRKVGWRIRRTAAHGVPPHPRGDRRLYPV